MFDWLYPYADKLRFPDEVEEQFREDYHANTVSTTTVLFADIVNFTQISARFAPHEVVDMLDELFSRFDELVDEYGVEKIQVAGDGYMVAAGVPTPRPDHAIVLAQLALDMLECVRNGEFLGGKHPIEIRIGLNSGSLLGGVIGPKKNISMRSGGIRSIQPAAWKVTAQAVRSRSRRRPMSWLRMILNVNIWAQSQSRAKAKWMSGT